jgi:hypothetical protein
MAEQEVAQHSKNIIDLVTSRQHTLAHRLREIAIEIATIVFAVSMSIWLHGLSEHYHQQQEVRSFLVGLREDLKADIGTVQHMVSAYHAFDDNFTYLASLDPGKEPDWGKFEKAYEYMDANWSLIPNKSRFDGFMSSGKLSNIEDAALLDAILDLYQSTLPQVQISEGGWLRKQQKLRDYRDDGLGADDRFDHYRLITSPKGKRLAKQMVTGQQHYARYQQYVNGSTQIIRKIDAAYPEATHAKAD